MCFFRMYAMKIASGAGMIDAASLDTLPRVLAPGALPGDASYSFYLLHSNLIGTVFQPNGEPQHLPVWRLMAGLVNGPLWFKKKREPQAAPAVAATP